MQVSGVMITREDFMVSIFDYNKDAEDAERAEKAAATSGDGSPGGTPDRNLSDGPSRRRGCRGRGAHTAVDAGGTADGAAGATPCEDGEDWLGGWQWVVPAWALAAVLAVALVLDKQAWLGSLLRQCKQQIWPRAQRRWLYCSDRCGASSGKCEV